MAHSVPHIGRTNGYRVSGTAAPSLICDHQQPYDGGIHIADAALELCDGADLLIHDAQYTIPEFEAKATWGHCTVEYAVVGGEGSGRQTARAVPSRPRPRRRGARCDRALLREFADQCGIELIAASEGLTVSFG